MPQFLLCIRALRAPGRQQKGAQKGPGAWGSVPGLSSLTGSTVRWIIEVGSALEGCWGIPVSLVNRLPEVPVAILVVSARIFHFPPTRHDAALVQNRSGGSSCWRLCHVYVVRAFLLPMNSPCASTTYIDVACLEPRVSNRHVLELQVAAASVLALGLNEHVACRRVCAMTTTSSTCQSQSTPGAACSFPGCPNGGHVPRARFLFRISAGPENTYIYIYYIYIYIKTHIK